jgi:hypothetical protein
MKTNSKTYRSHRQDVLEHANAKVPLRIWIIVGALIAVFMAENIYEMRRQSCSSDEVLHLPAGYTYLVKQDFRLNPEHPPLLKELCALPLLFLKPKVDFSDPDWLQPSTMSQSKFGYSFLYSNPPRADQFLFWGRLGWHVASSMASFPYSLSYFNEFVGGPSKGIYWLDDSYIDLGQELKGVKSYMEANGIEVVTLFSFSPHDNPKYYGINQTGITSLNPNSPPPGIYVVSAHRLTRLKLKGFDMLSRYPVIGHLGYSMYIFKIS